jgi:hypothetical protein
MSLAAHGMDDGEVSRSRSTRLDMSILPDAEQNHPWFLPSIGCNNHPFLFSIGSCYHPDCWLLLRPIEAGIGDYGYGACDLVRVCCSWITFAGFPMELGVLGGR